MDAERAEFLTSMISILERLQQTCVNRGEPLLASVLAIAKGEAEDAHRHAEELASINALREKMSSRTSWRAQEQERVAAELRRDIGYAGAEVRDLADAMDAAEADEIAA